MADESLFDFLHMEIVSHIYKEQQSGKGEMDNKVCSIKAGNSQLTLNVKNNLRLELHCGLGAPFKTLSLFGINCAG